MVVAALPSHLRTRARRSHACGTVPKPRDAPTPNVRRASTVTRTMARRIKPTTQAGGPLRRVTHCRNQHRCGVYSTTAPTTGSSSSRTPSPRDTSSIVRSSFTRGGEAAGCTTPRHADAGSTEVARATSHQWCRRCGATSAGRRRTLQGSHVLARRRCRTHCAMALCGLRRCHHWARMAGGRQHGIVVCVLRCTTWLWGA